MEEIQQKLDHLFRHKSGQIIAVLTRIFGFENLALAEDVVQETLVKALQQWPFSGIPANPGGWILQTAKNQALDVLRREAAFRQKEPDIVRDIESRFSRNSEGGARGSTEFEDEQLTLMFACCHPAFTRDAQASLILKTLCGFSTSEIARSFLTSEATIAQRFVRSKRKIKDENIRFELPAPSELVDRLRTVLDVLYLLFNEGYSASQGDDLVRTDLCDEAIRLLSMLVKHHAGNQPEAHALLALLLLQASRLPARIDSHGNLLVLMEQDRSLWNRELVQMGLEHLRVADSGGYVTEYHLEAGIAACHATAEKYESTNWSAILAHYNLLVELNPTPVVKLNRAVAVAMVYGPEAGIRELDMIRGLDRYYLLPATYADFYRRMGQREKAAEYYRTTLDLVTTDPERRFIVKRLTEL